MEEIELDLVDETVNYFIVLCKEIELAENAKEDQKLSLLNEKFKKHVRDASHFLEHYLFLCEIGVININSQTKKPFWIADDERDRIDISTEPISASKLVFNINKIVSDRPMKKLKSTQVTDWLMKQGYLQEDSSGLTSHKICTLKSGEIGITPSERMNTHNQTYQVNLYDQNAQKFVIDNSNQISLSSD